MKTEIPPRLPVHRASLFLRKFASSCTVDHKLANNHDNGCLLGKVIAAVRCNNRQAGLTERRGGDRKNTRERKKKKRKIFWTNSERRETESQKNCGNVRRVIFVEDTRNRAIFFLSFSCNLLPAVSRVSSTTENVYFSTCLYAFLSVEAESFRRHVKCVSVCRV